jgi:hypothetical protein
MIARREGIEVSTAGEALDAGARGAMVRVRNAGSGQVVRMRVAGPGTVEPVDTPGDQPLIPCSLPASRASLPRRPGRWHSRPWPGPGEGLGIAAGAERAAEARVIDQHLA